MTHPTPETIVAMAQLSGVTIDSETARRILRSIGPALDNFASIASVLPLDCEPSGFRLAQKSGNGA